MSRAGHERRIAEGVGERVAARPVDAVEVVDGEHDAVPARALAGARRRTSAGPRPRRTGARRARGRRLAPATRGRRRRRGRVAPPGWPPPSSRAPPPPSGRAASWTMARPQRPVADLGPRGIRARSAPRRRPPPPRRRGTRRRRRVLPMPTSPTTRAPVSERASARRRLEPRQVLGAVDERERPGAWPLAGGAGRLGARAVGAASGVGAGGVWERRAGMVLSCVGRGRGAALAAELLDAGLSAPHAPQRMAPVRESRPGSARSSISASASPSAADISSASWIAVVRVLGERLQGDLDERRRGSCRSGATSRGSGGGCGEVREHDLRRRSRPRRAACPVSSW